MGQKVGKVVLIDAVQPFLCLSRRSLINSWQVFNHVADGFGITRDELQEILRDLKGELNVSHVSMNEKTSDLFDCFDTDSNGLIDALEFFSAIAIISGMRKTEILDFIFNMYDFDGTETLSLDEVTLSLKSSCTGLCKLQQSSKLDASREIITVPKEELIEQLVSVIFDMYAPPAGDELEISHLNTNLIRNMLVVHPDIMYWFHYFGVPKQTGIAQYIVSEQEIDYEKENMIADFNTEDIAGIDWNVTYQYKSVEQDIAKSWLSLVAMLTPIEFADGKKLTKFSPDCSIIPEWVYGYQSEKSKNNLFYNCNGNVIYHVSRYAIIYNFFSHSQNLFTGHNNEILCLNMHPGGEFAASGELGVMPALLVWSTISKRIVFHNNTFHKNGVIHCKFSSGGSLLASLGNDPFHSLMVSLWEDSTIIYTSNVTQQKCLSLAVLSSGTVVVGGESFLHFWNKSAYHESYDYRPGNYSRLSTIQTISCLTAIDNSETVVAGSSSGQLLLWTDANCVRTLKAHTGTINALYSCHQGLLSGGKDHRVRVWTHSLDPVVTFDMSHFGINPSVRSVCLSSDGTSILVGTKGSNIFEISAIDGSDLRGGPIAVGHSYGQINYAATHPSKFEYITVGEDQTLRVFDMKTKLQIKLTSFDANVSAIIYGPLGDIIVVGFGSSSINGAKKSGTFIVMNEEDMSVVHEARDSSHAVTLIKFSPEGDTLAIGTNDGSIYLYAVQDDYELIGKCVRHTAAVTQLDFSVDGEWIRSNSKNFELCFFNADDASYQSNIASMRDVPWATNSCIYTWHTKGIHASPYNSELVVQAQTPGENPNQFILTGSNLGYLGLYSFPVVFEDCELHRLPAHCKEVGALQFTFDSSYVISLGRYDRSIIQWECVLHNKDDPSQVSDDAIVGERVDVLESRPVDKLMQEFMPLESIQPVGTLNASNLNEMDKQLPLSSVLNSPEDDAWLANIVDPTIPPSQQLSPLPEMSMVLEYVYGYQPIRNSVRYVAAAKSSSPSTQIAYTASSVGVVLNTRTRSQLIYKCHTDNISAYACSRSGMLIATGQSGHNPIVTIWDSQTCDAVCVVPEIQLVSVCCLAFSDKYDDIIGIASNDVNHTITVYNWKNKVPVCKAYGGMNALNGICFHDECSLIEEHPKSLGLVSYGVHEIKLWSDVNSRFPVCVRPVLGATGGSSLSKQFFLCCEIFENKPSVGTIDGNLFVFDGSHLKHSIKAHNGALNAIHCLGTGLKGGTLATGGSDGAVRVWSATYDCLKEFVIDSILTGPLQSSSPIVVSVAFNFDGSTLVIGTKGAEIFEIMAADGKLVNSSQGGKGLLVDGYGSRELHGLASHPNKEVFATSGDDGTIRIWDAKSFRQIKSVKMEIGSRTITFSPDGKNIAIGFGSNKRTKGKLPLKEGSFIILKSSDLRVIHEGKDSNNAIRVIKYSPDGKYLACGSEDCNIYMYNIKEQYIKLSTIRCHTAAVLYIDFSADSNYIMSVDAAKRVCYSETATGVLVPTPSIVRDTKWSTSSNPHQWSVQGFWFINPNNKSTEPIITQKSWNSQLVCAGTRAGSIHLGYYPFVNKKGFIRALAHTGPVSQLAWIAGDGSLVSIGSKDHTIMQWKCVYENSRELVDETQTTHMQQDIDSEVEIDGGHQKMVPLKQKVSTIIGADESMLEPDSSSAVVPDRSLWRNMVCPPSTPLNDPIVHPAQQIELTLEFIHGVRAADSRFNIRYNEDNLLLYPSSGFGVIFDRNNLTQKYYCGHNKTIIACDVDHSGKIAATGELGSNASIHIWNAKTGDYIKDFPSVHQGGVTSLRFSRNSKYLVSLGQDSLHSIAIFYSSNKTWNDGFMLTSASVSPSKMMWILHVDHNEYPVVVGGVNSISFFKIIRGCTERIRGEFGKQYKMQPLLCAVEGEPSNNGPQTERCILTGTLNGYVYIYLQQKLVNKFSAHECPINVITKSSLGYITGGKEGLIKVWSFGTYKLLQSYNTQYFIPRPFGLSCHSITANNDGSRFIVGTRSGELYEVTSATNSHMLLIESHSHYELHGLAINPSNADEYVTCGDDGMIRIWSISRKYCLRKMFIEFAARAIVWSSDGGVLIVGIGGVPSMSSKDGAFMVINAITMEIIREERKSKEALTEIKFSPDGSIFGVSSKDGRVYVHDGINSAYKFHVDVRSVSLHKECGVMAFDFSFDNHTLRINSDANEVFYYSLVDSEFISSPVITRDTVWHTHTCPLSWTTQGSYRENIDEVVLLSVNVHPNNNILAASYANGNIRIYAFPCQHQQ
eukprot:gene9724-13087_t